MKSIFTLIVFAFNIHNVFSQSVTSDTTIMINGLAEVIIPMPKEEKWLVNMPPNKCVAFRYLKESIEIFSGCHETQKVALTIVSREEFDFLMAIKNPLNLFDKDYPLLDVPRPKNE